MFQAGCITPSISRQRDLARAAASRLQLSLTVVFEKGGNMKKLFAITLMVLTLGFAGWSETQAAASNEVSQVVNAVPQEWGYRQHDRNWRNRGRVRVVRTSRIVRYGFRTYRETYLVRYLPNGRTQTTLISRDRIA